MQMRPDAANDIFSDIVEMIHNHIEALKDSGEYNSLSQKVMEFKLNIQVFDILGQTMNNHSIHNMFSMTADIDRQFRLAEAKLGNDGTGNQYQGRCYNLCR